MHEQFEERGLAVVGVHSPEFEHEKSRQAVERARGRHGLTYPSFIDSGHAYWRALGNRYWPTSYLIDPRGRIRQVQIGEVRPGSAAARRLKNEIEALLAGRE